VTGEDLFLLRTSGYTSAVGILANPASGRDVRRLVAQASVFQLSEKCNMIVRILAALGSVGIGEVFMMPDVIGLAERVRRTIDDRPFSNSPWPLLRMLDMPVEDGPGDTLRAVKLMVKAGVGAIVVLGGDGTHRLVASACGATPIMALSTGTNNAFPGTHEATVAGLAAGLVAAGLVSRTGTLVRNKVLRVEVNETRRDLALVDVSISRELWIGSRALWRPEYLAEVFIAFSEPGVVGLSCLAGFLHPVSRDSNVGVRLELVPHQEAATVLMAPVAPGLIAPVGIAAVHQIRAGELQTVQTRRGVIALDGEREIEFMDHDRITIRLENDGPLTIDLKKVLAEAAEEGLWLRFTQSGRTANPVPTGSITGCD
jgi:predicted polyphosphate/ATP-dependent NAD kinase